MTEELTEGVRRPPHLNPAQRRAAALLGYDSEILRNLLPGMTDCVSFTEKDGQPAIQWNGPYGPDVIFHREYDAFRRDQHESQFKPWSH